MKIHHFKNSNRELSVDVSLFLLGIVAHGTPSDDFQVSIVIPILKGRNFNSSDSTNNRGIAISSIYGNIFDQIICSHYKLCTSDLQFGFKRHHSTNMCTMVLKEAISYYVNNGSSVIGTLLDATKAFYRVKYVKLFELLMVRDISPVSLRLLLNIYTCNGTRIA